MADQGVTPRQRVPLSRRVNGRLQRRLTELFAKLNEGGRSPIDERPEAEAFTRTRTRQSGLAIRLERRLGAS